MTTTSIAAPVSLVETVRRLQTGSVTPVDVVTESLGRIRGLEPEVQAWVSVDAEAALEAAAGLANMPGDKRGRLWGIPVGVKDIIDVAGTRTGCGSKVRQDAAAAPADASCVAALRSNGGVVLGKTVTTEYGYFAPGPTRNPHDPFRTPGGSSSGSAAAVAAGMVPFAFGTQTAGSLTRPASYCGVAGFVAARGSLPTDGITGLSHSLDSLGFLAAGVADVRAAWAAVAGIENSARPVREPRILVWHGHETAVVSDDMQAALQAALGMARAGGASVESLARGGAVADLPVLQANVMAYEAARMRPELADKGDQLSPPLVELLAHGRSIGDADYRQSAAGIAAARRDLTERLQPFDAILGPAAPGAAPAGLLATGDPVLSRPWQALGLPVVTVPGLRDGAGLPLGLQLIGLPGNEQRLFDVAEWLEAKFA